LIAKHAPRATAPIMLAQSLAERPDADDDWADDHVLTTARKPSQQFAAEPRNPDQEETRNERRPSAAIPAQAFGRVDDDDPYGRTIVAPPVFVDEESTIGQAEREAAAAAVLGSAAVTQGGARATTATVVDEDAAPTLTGTETRAEPTASTPQLDDEPPRRAPSEHMYVGPPAPRMPLVNTFLGTYRRSIFVGAAAGVLAVAIAVLAVRSCRSQAAAAPNDAAIVAPEDAGAAAATMPAKKRPAAKTTGSGSAR
jgi:hypothetical protein